LATIFSTLTSRTTLMAKQDSITSMASKRPRIPQQIPAPAAIWIGAGYFMHNYNRAIWPAARLRQYQPTPPFGMTEFARRVKIARCLGSRGSRYTDAVDRLRRDAPKRISL